MFWLAFKITAFNFASHYTSIIAYLFCQSDDPITVCVLKHSNCIRKKGGLGLNLPERSLIERSQTSVDLVNIQLLVRFQKSWSIGKRAGLGLLFGILPKQKQPYLPPLRWICKWPEKAPVSSALWQQRHRWVCYTLLEIPTRCWSLRMRFMQHKPPHTIDCHSALLAAFVKGRLNQIDTIYSICPHIHMYAALCLINSFQWWCATQRDSM